jgi:DNA-binding CsgD family transcriptional regulator
MITPIDLQNLSVLLPQLYIAKSMRDFPAHALSTLAQIMDLEGASDGWVDWEEEIQTDPVGSSPVELTDLDRVFGEAIREYPILESYFHSYQGGGQKIAQLIDESDRYRLEQVYWRLMPSITLNRPMSLVFSDSDRLGTTHAIYLLDGDMIALTISHSELALSERDRYLLEFIYPHIWQAYQNAVTFTTRERKLAQRDRALDLASIILLSEQGEVEAMGERACQILRKYFLTSTMDVIPEILADWLQGGGLSHRGTAAFTPPDEPLEMEIKGRRLQVTAIPNPAGSGYILSLLEEHTRSFSIDQIQHILGLSKREAEVLFWIAQDRDNQEISELIDCSLSTVKKHIEKIYQKLGVKSRTAAAIHAFKQVGMLDIAAE